jgi:hypothetical protein
VPEKNVRQLREIREDLNGLHAHGDGTQVTSARHRAEETSVLALARRERTRAEFFHSSNTSRYTPNPDTPYRSSSRNRPLSVSTCGTFFQMGAISANILAISLRRSLVSALLRDRPQFRDRFPAALYRRTVAHSRRSAALQTRRAMRHCWRIALDGHRNQPSLISSYDSIRRDPTDVASCASASASRPKSSWVRLAKSTIETWNMFT